MASEAAGSSSSTDAPAPHVHIEQSHGKDHGEPVAEPPSVADNPARMPSGATLSRLLKGKEREWHAISSKTGPLHLLDLPVDILRLIVKEVVHTNDLTSLALTNSTLYYLAIPHIYSRFDIVWPDTSGPVSDSKSVDALTYGLSTLCLGSRFGQKARWLRNGSQDHATPSRRLVDNQYAKYTRTFSLGNGPPNWTSEYVITSESGKMLGTLVALAVAKMVSLETFIWDMPTGVLSDIFMSLASLQDHYKEGEPKLEKVWIRWHDNLDVSGTSSTVSSPIQPPVPPHPPPMVVPIPAPPSTVGGDAMWAAAQTTRRQAAKYSESNVEYPTFSILPALRSLTVLDIDEIAYIDEMAVLIERSVLTLRELRVGISQKASTSEFAHTWVEPGLQQIDHNARWPGESQIGNKRLGGVLGALVGRIYDIRKKWPSKSREDESGEPSTEPSIPGTSAGAGETSASTEQIPVLSVPYTYADDGTLLPLPQNATSWATSSRSQQGEGGKAAPMARKRLDGKLRLETLELERISLHMQVFTRAFDWTFLTRLTILNCPYHDSLWKVLKRHFQPTLPPYGSAPGAQTHYQLALKHIHTDIASESLISFIRETLAPNSLEVLFLHDRRRSGQPPVHIEKIFRAAIKRHRTSLKKLLLDSAERRPPPEGSMSRRWTHWMLTSEMVSYITSGRMSALRELAACLDFKDWHPFLQRLPNIPHLRSLHIPNLQDHITGTFEQKELALQITDIITLRPEIQLCYVGIGNKCFEIVETRPRENGQGHSDFGLSGHPGVVVIGGDDDDDSDDGTLSAPSSTTSSSGSSAGDDDSVELSDEAGSDADSTHDGGGGGPGTRLRLREILFYDDRVAIFKARHAKL
jgi:hypothetical protein